MQHDSFVADQILIHSLEKRSTPIAWSGGRILFHQGDVPAGVYILQSGAAALIMKSASGRTVMCDEACPGSLLGLPGIVANEPYTVTAMPRKGSMIRFVTRNDFEDLLRTEPALQLPVLQLLAAEVRTARLTLSET